MRPGKLRETVLAFTLPYLIGLLVFATAAMRPLAAQTLADETPNVVLIITDDQGYGDIRAHGNPKINTPQIDQLYERSVRLTNFHVDPTCSPTRAALMSGRYSTRAGVWHTICGRSLMRPEELTLAEIFRANGYQTAMFGKWHLGDAFPCRPQDQGFEHVVHHGGGGVGQTPDHWGNDYFDDTYWVNGELTPFEGYCTDVWFREAMKYIDGAKDKPFFVYLSTNAPHGPYFVDEKYSRPYGEGAVANFMGMITNIDENVGQLVTFLRERDLERNTILIFMTDNGTAAGDTVFNAGMRGKKGSPYDGGHRVPFFVHWPAGELTGGRDVDQLTAHVDVRPTLVELCGLTEPEGPRGDGASLVPILRGDTTQLRDRSLFVHSQRILHPRKGRQYSVMTDRWRLVNGQELFDMHDDPGQRKNVANEHPTETKQLTAAYDRWWESLEPAMEQTVYQRLGSDQQPEVRLTAHDWLFDGMVAWHQNAIGAPDNRSKHPKSGPWGVEFVKPGSYECQVSRWPRHLQRAMEATGATLQVGDDKYEVAVDPQATMATFRFSATAGTTMLQPALTGAEGQAIGAYYAYVRRVGDAP